MELHVLLAGVEFGPYTDEKARELLGEGFLSSTDPAKRLDATEWMPLSDLLGASSTPAPSQAGASSAPQSFTPFFADDTETTEPATESGIEPEPYEEEPAVAAADPVEVAEEKKEPVVLPPPVAFADTKRVRPATSSLKTSSRPPTVPIPAPAEIKSSFVKALAATRSMTKVVPASGAAPPLETSLPTRASGNVPTRGFPPPEPADETQPPETPFSSHAFGTPKLDVSDPGAATEIPPPQVSDPEPSLDTPPRLTGSPPARPVGVTPPLQVSVPVRGAKKTTVTGSLLAKEALHAARDRSGILPPIRQNIGRMTAPVPEFEPEPPPPRKRTPLVLGGDRDEPAPQPPQRKAIRLTGRIALPGTSSQTNRLVSPGPTSDTGAGMVARLSKADMEPAAEVKSAPLQLRERRESNLLKPQARKAIRLTGPISLPGRATQPTPPAMPITAAKLPAKEIPSWQEPATPSIEAKAPTEETPSVPPEEAKTPGDEVHAEPAPGATTPPAEAHSHAPELERTAELAAAAALAAEIVEPGSKEADPTASGSLSGTGHLLSTGELAERRSLKVTGALKHTLPARQPIQLSSSSGDSGRLAQPGEERAAAAMLPPALEPKKAPAPPVPEEELPNRAPTGKIPVSEMPTEGVRIRRRITTKIPLPEKPTESLAHESPPRRLPPPLPRQEEPAPIAAPDEPVSSALPVAETVAEIAPAIESFAPSDEELATPVAADIPATEASATPIEEEPVETTPVPTPEPAPVVARPEQVRLRRPVKLELSSRAKIQDSGRLTLEAFSKMASLELPKATPTPVSVPVAQAGGAAPMTIEPESETPAERPSIESAGTAQEPAHDFAAPPLTESLPAGWQPSRPKKSDRSIVWIIYAIIALGIAGGIFLVATGIILYTEHRDAGYQGTPSTDSPAPTPPAPTSPAPSTPINPPASASPPAASSAPPSAPPPSASAPATPPAPAQPTSPTPATPPAASTPATPPAAPAPAPATPPASAAADIQRQAGAFVSDGILKYQRGDFDDAIAAYNQAIDLDPKLAEAYFNRGIAKAAHDDLDGAIADYSQALQVDPTLGAAFYYRGLARHSKGDLDGAITDYNQAVQLDPKNAFALFNRGLIRMQKDDIDGAIVDSSRALELDPKMIQSYYDRGLGRLAKGEVDGALTDMKAFCEQAPQDGYTDYARLYIWLIQTQQGKLAEANQELTAAMNNGWNGKPEDMVTRIGEYLLGQIGENDLIRASASSIPIKDQGQRCEAWYFIGMRKLEAGDKDAGIDALQKCIATQKIDYCEYILAQEMLKSLGGNAAAAPRPQPASLPDPGTMAPPSAPAPQ